MCTARVFISALLIACATAGIRTQSPTAQPAFDVVSIKRTSGTSLQRMSERPDGGFSATNYRVVSLISQAYPPAVPSEMIGLPSWANTERYDIRATSMLSNATRDQRRAMLRAMLADRFKLAVHTEEREQPVFELVLARSDGRLGPGLKPTEMNCEARANEDRDKAETEAANPLPATPRSVDRTAPIPDCTVRMKPNRMDGYVTMDGLATMLRAPAGRFVVNKTGLVGTYSIAMEYDRISAMRGPDAVAVDGPPSVFTAVQQQLGLKLVSARAARPVLIIDRLEKPNETNVP